MKKFKGDEEEKEEHYKMLDTETGEVIDITPEFCIMSRGSPKNENPIFRGGIGKGWVEKYKSDTDKDFVTLRGQKMNLPKYYDTVLEKMGEDIEKRKVKRMKKFKKKEQTMERLKAKEKCKKASIRELNRNLQEFN